MNNETEIQDDAGAEPTPEPEPATETSTKLIGSWTVDVNMRQVMTDASTGVEVDLPTNDALEAMIRDVIESAYQGVHVTAYAKKTDS